MKPQEALNIVYAVCGKVQLVREDHVKVQEAFQVLQATITPKPVESKEETPKKK